MSLPVLRGMVGAIDVYVRACSLSVDCAFVFLLHTYFWVQFSQRYFCGGNLSHGTPGTGLCLWTSDIWQQESSCRGSLLYLSKNFETFFFDSLFKCQGTSLLFLMLCTLQCIFKNSLRYEFLDTWCVIQNKFIWRCIKPLLLEPLFHVAFVSVRSISGF